MTKHEFDAAVDQLLVQFGGSLTSGRRTDAHSVAVGGFAGDPHTWGLGADVVWDDPTLFNWRYLGPQFQETDTTKVPEYVVAQATRLGLRLLEEKDHTHIQPLDFPAGPVTSYGGVTRPLPGHD